MTRLLVLLVTIVLAIPLPSASATLPPGFTETLIASGLTSPTTMAFAPDGRLFVCQQTGELRVIRDGQLLPTPFVTVETDVMSERGLLGVTFDPNFGVNQYVYVFYTAVTPAIHNRISRFTASGDVAVPGSEVVILDLPSVVNANHNGGAIHFGQDGKLYIAVGEDANPSLSQRLDSVFGKMLRINADGSIPTDNPFYEMTTGINRAIWALGLRNPFNFAFQPGSGRLFINDVGGSIAEEINDGIVGSNYGWPICEGDCNPPNPAFRDPVHFYLNVGPVCAIVGAAFYNPPVQQFPGDYLGDYFFADLCGGWIRRFDPIDGTVTGFATGISFPVDVRIGPDGSLYYLGRGAGGVVYRVQFESTGTFHSIDLTVDSTNRTRLLRAHEDGRASLWTIAPDGTRENTVTFGPTVGWSAKAVAVGSDGRSRLLWTHSSGRAAVWFLSAAGAVETTFEDGPYAGWTAQDVAVGSDDRTRLLWTHTGGQLALWFLSPGGSYETQVQDGPYAGWSAVRIDAGTDNRTRLLWGHVDGRASITFVSASGVFESSTDYGPFPDRSAIDVGVGPDGKTRLLWRQPSGLVIVWVVSAIGTLETSQEYGPFDGWMSLAIDAGADNKSRLLWGSTGASTSVWVLSETGAYETQFNFGPDSGSLCQRGHLFGRHP